MVSLTKRRKFIFKKQRQTIAANGMYSRNARTYRHRRHPARKVAVIVTVLLVVWIVGAGASGLYLKKQADTGIQQAHTLVASVKSGTQQEVQSDAEALNKTIHGVKRCLSNPFMLPVRLFPYVGHDLRGVCKAVRAIDGFTQDSLVSLSCSVSAALSGGLTDDEGEIKGDVVDNLLTAFEEASPGIAVCNEQIQDIAPMRIDRLESVFGPAKETLGQVAALAEEADAFVPLARYVLGLDEPRSFLVIAQNSAELHAGGGFAGSIGLMSTDNAAIDLGDFGSVWDVTEDDLPSGFEVTDQEVSFFSSWVNHPRDSTLNPDFPRAASILVASYEETTETSVDGAITATPVLVQRILQATGGSMTLSDGTFIDGTNATRVLQHDMYWHCFGSGDYTDTEANELSDSLFSEAAKGTFHILLDDLSIDKLKVLIPVMLDAMENRELMVWSESEDIQDAIVQIGCSGSVSGPEAVNELGVYFNLIQACKLGWFMDVQTEISEPVEQDGMLAYSVTTSVTNTLSPEEGEGSPEYLVGTFKGAAIYGLYFYAPLAGQIVEAQLSTGEAMACGTYAGRGVCYVRSQDQDQNIPPGESITATCTVLLPADSQEGLTLRTMPTLTEFRLEQG